MRATMRGVGGLPLTAMALAVGIWGCSGHSAPADGPTGFQGFGLGYHLGYGYGGAAVGVGPDGGYPFYGGPGYPHCPPPLRRLGRIVPFAYYGGPGYPTPDEPNYFGGVGPLVADRPAITLGRGDGGNDYTGDYGPFTGTLPYPETQFATFSTPATTGASPAAPPAAPPPGPGGSLEPAPVRGERIGSNRRERRSPAAGPTPPAAISGSASASP